MGEEKESMSTESEGVVSSDPEESPSAFVDENRAENHTSFHLDLERLLTPISGDNPAGQFLRYEGMYDRIQEARKEDADLPQGVWERELKKADWNKVREFPPLCG